MKTISGDFPFNVPIDDALRLMAAEPQFGILRLLSAKGAMSFAEIVRAAEAGDRTTTRRLLDELERENLLVTAQDARGRQTLYALTEKSCGLLEAAEALEAWARVWQGAEETAEAPHEVSAPQASLLN